MVYFLCLVPCSTKGSVVNESKELVTGSVSATSTGGLTAACIEVTKGALEGVDETSSLHKLDSVGKVTEDDVLKHSRTLNIWF